MSPAGDVRRLRLLRRLTMAFFAAYAFFVTFPGVLPFRGPRPFILGMPLPIVWIALWVIGGGLMLWLLDRAASASAAGGADEATPGRDQA